MKTTTTLAATTAAIALANAGIEIADVVTDRCDEPGITACAVERGRPVDYRESERDEAVARPPAVAGSNDVTIQLQGLGISSTVGSIAPSIS